MPNNPIRISVCGMSSDIPHDETVKSYILANCPSAVVTIRSIAGGIEQRNLLYQAYQAALDAGDDIICDAWNWANTYYPFNTLFWSYNANFNAVVNSIVDAGKIVLSASTASGDTQRLPARFILTSNNSATLFNMWGYGQNATESWSLGQVAGIVGQLWINHPTENNFDIMARLLGGTSLGLGNRINAGGWGLARFAESNALATLSLLPTLLPRATKSNDNKSVLLNWQNPEQTLWNKTIIVQASTGLTIYEGTGTSFTWNSNVGGSETFKFYSVDAQGNTSRDESYTQITITGLEVAQITTPTLSAEQSGSTIQLSWDAIPNTLHYTLERKFPFSDNWEVIGNLYSTAHVDNPIFSNTTYNYRLKAIATNGYDDSNHTYLNLRTSHFEGQQQVEQIQRSKQPLSNSVRFGDQLFNTLYFGQPEGSFRTLEKYMPRFIT